MREPPGVTQLNAVLHVLRSYECAKLTLDRGQRRVLREVICAVIARDVVDEELDIDDQQSAA